MATVRPSQPASSSTRLTLSDDELRAAFGKLSSRREVAALLDLPYWQFDWLVRRSPTADRYKQATIRKRRGGVRALLVPEMSLRIAQRKLVQALTAVYRPKACVHGFAKDRSVVTNARRHVARRWVLNVDLRDFFPSINFGRVRGAFMAKPFCLPAEAATALAQLCCHDNQLPQGAPSSPIVANIVCGRLDGQLLLFAKRHYLRYTRFADDLTFSATVPSFPVEVAEAQDGTTAKVGSELEGIIVANGFQVNPDKVHLQGDHARKEVTGLTVNEFPNVRRTFVRQVRAMLHAWEKHGYASAQAEYRTKWQTRHRAPGRGLVSFRRVVRGKIEFLRMVRGQDDTIVKRLLTRYAALTGTPAPPKDPRWSDVVRSSMVVLESEDTGDSDIVYQGTAFAIDGLGYITCEHVLRDGTQAFRHDASGARYPVVVRHSSKGLDLALISIDGPSIPGLPMDLSSRPDVGDEVRVAGFPQYRLGDTGHFFRSHVVGRRAVAGKARIMVSGPVAGGMSGGPALSLTGEVIGVVVSGAERLSNTDLTEGHAFIPAEVLAEFLAQAVEQGAAS